MQFFLQQMDFELVDDANIHLAGWYVSDKADQILDCRSIMIGSFLDGVSGFVG
jgi:hypothetical protein